MSHQPDASDALPPLVHARKATWFELFFDLVFVVAVAQLSGHYAHHFDAVGAAGSALLLMAMWWCWLGHTFHATRFDQQRPDQRWLGLAQILAVCVIAYGVSDAFGERAAGFALGLAAFKALLVLAYRAERRWRGAQGLIAAYSGLYGLQALLWAVSAWLPPTPRLLLWGLALALDLASPWWVARYTAAVPPHPEHLPERFGLFTIILLGEVPRLGGEQREGRIARGTEDGAERVVAGDRPLPALARNDDAVRRFIALVDECYDRRVPLYIEAEVALEALYTQGYLELAFRRTLSRLREMQLQRFGAS